MADNFNYPPDWTPNQSKENRRGNFGHKTDPQNCEYVITSGAQKKVEEYEAEDAETMELTAEQEKGKLADPFYRLEHQEVDLQKKKAAEPFLVRLQRVSDARHADGTQKTCSRRRGCFKEAIKAASNVKSKTKFDKNRKDKRALIHASSIFPESDYSVSSSSKRRMELEGKRRKITAASASNLLRGGFKASALSKTPSTSKCNEAVVLTTVLEMNQCKKQ
ncbi:unnamed protein product [Arabidopsis thaliana]|uniref:Uncharacterized protein n=1 Tax=Arabidopsis thaliana TaxID=3702 RepID=A0A654ECW6_ARATH|nr:unnamed protein product [Arabidopsis thaliana]